MQLRNEQGLLGQEMPDQEPEQEQEPESEGVTAVEFALVLPLLLIIVFGIIEIAIVLYDKSVITSASREAARSGVVLRKERLTEAGITAVAFDYAQNKLISFAPSQAGDLAVQVTKPEVPQSLDVLGVTVSYQYRGLGLGAMLTAFTGPIQISSSSAMLYE
jgi:Flp pilus assembly protein TadG